MTDPTPAPTAPLTEASEALVKALMPWLMVPTESNERKLRRWLLDVEREAAAREQADAEVARLRGALEELDRTYRAHLDAWNGRGHPGEAHDRDLHKYHSHGESPEESGCSLTRDDCAGCAGAMYGSDVEHGDAHCAARAALATRPPTPSPEQGAGES